MYRVQIEVTTRQSGRLHLERESYTKAKESRLFSSTGPGRKPAENRRVVSGIWYVLWTGCQWKAVHRDWFGGAVPLSISVFNTGSRGVCLSV